MSELTKLRITSEPCSACPFKGRIALHPGRLKEIVASTGWTPGEDGSYFVCHKTVYVCCRPHMPPWRPTGCLNSRCSPDDQQPQQGGNEDG